MKFEFTCSGHENVLSRHRNTIEFTKDKELSKDGDCIIGVNADFDSRKLIAFVDNVKRIKIVMKVEDLTEEFFAQINKDFSDSHEIVFRITEFKSSRTLGIKATKAAKDIDRGLIEKMKSNDAKMQVMFEAVE